MENQKLVCVCARALACMCAAGVRWNRREEATAGIDRKKTEKRKKERKGDGRKKHRQIEKQIDTERKRESETKREIDFPIYGQGSPLGSATPRLTRPTSTLGDRLYLASWVGFCQSSVYGCLCLSSPSLNRYTELTNDTGNPPCSSLPVSVNFSSWIKLHRQVIGLYEQFIEI